MERYDRPLQQTTRFDGARVNQTCRPTVIKPTITDVVVPAGERDRFDIIANRVYGSAKDWWKIAAVNGKVNGSLHVSPGADLIIPTE